MSIPPKSARDRCIIGLNLLMESKQSFIICLSSYLIQRWVLETVKNTMYALSVLSLSNILMLLALYLSNFVIFIMSSEDVLVNIYQYCLLWYICIAFADGSIYCTSTRT